MGVKGGNDLNKLNDKFKKYQYQFQMYIDNIIEKIQTYITIKIY